MGAAPEVVETGIQHARRASLHRQSGTEKAEVASYQTEEVTPSNIAEILFAEAWERREMMSMITMITRNRK